jgi:hypothetical protein
MFNGLRDHTAESIRSVPRVPAGPDLRVGLADGGRE